MIKKITNREMGKMVDKSESTVKNWKQTHPKLLELVQIGAFCKKNNLTISNIIDILEFKKKMMENLK